MYEQLFQMLEPALKPFRAQIGAFEADVFAALVPEMDEAAIDARPAKGWAFASLEHALVPLAVYAIIVLAGIIRFATCGPKAKSASGSKQARQSKCVQLISSPLRILMLVYNVVQVRLSLVSCSSTSIHARQSSTNW